MKLSRLAVMLLLFGFSTLIEAMECPPPGPDCSGESCYGAYYQDNPCVTWKYSYELPEPVTIWCNRADMEYHCEAWPQGDVSYHWTSGGSVSLLQSGTTTSPLQAIYCSGVGSDGWVELTVTSTFGLGSSKFMGINCGPPTQEY
jgi:hypothetical protein